MRACRVWRVWGEREHVLVFGCARVRRVVRARVAAARAHRVTLACHMASPADAHTTQQHTQITWDVED
jgi:hypothetical protein